ncbi:MAG: hypothetical protein IPK63_20835 [Candidatus Competibacteraceae bacterium]|nr:hypothetical protein [Candidatus Competibacteraceae bacterium]
MSATASSFRINPTLSAKNRGGPLRWGGWLAVLLALTPLALLAAQSAPAPLHRLFLDSQSQAYQAPSSDELKQAEYLFRQAFNGAMRPQQRAAWTALGFQVERITDNQQVFTVIREQSKRRRGRGFYVFAIAPASAPILQAPHALDDKHTGAIAIALLAENQFIAGAWSTAPRRHQNDDDETVTDSDMAHQSDSYFIAFSRAAALAQPASAILQLHGFNAAKRKTEAGRRAGVIVSAGQSEPTPVVEQTVRCLRGELRVPVLTYPRDIKELGALTNEIGETLRALGRSSFVHIEMGQPLRDQLYTDATLRQRIGGCLARVRP